MRTVIFLLCVVASISVLSAQNSNRKKLIKQEVKSMVKAYDLGRSQAKLVTTIQENHFEYFEEIEHLKLKAPELYWKNSKSIRAHTDAQLMDVLKGQQLDLLQQQIRLRNQKEAALLRKRGKEQEQIDEIYLELAELYL